jgi:hypothetical protein
MGELNERRGPSRSISDNGSAQPAAKHRLFTFTLNQDRTSHEDNHHLKLEAAFARLLPIGYEERSPTVVRCCIEMLAEKRISDFTAKRLYNVAQAFRPGYVSDGSPP